MFYIEKPCIFCGQWGQVGFRLCSDHQSIVLMCDECGTVWLDPTKVDDEHALYLSSPEFIIPALNCSLAARWATQEEIASKGWDRYIRGESQALDED